MPTTIFVIVLAVILALFAITRYTVERIGHNHYAQRSDFFHRYPVNKGDIVFVGDSITDGGAWEELLPGVPLKNRGINADTTIGVLNRINDILCCNPRAVFLLIGTNDLPWYEYRSNDAILRTYAQILDKCRQLSPDTKVFVQSILPRKRAYAKRIQGLNAQIQQLSTLFDCTFIDLFPSFADANGELQAEITNDHLHLMAPGYSRWVEILNPYIKALLA